MLNSSPTTGAQHPTAAMPPGIGIGTHHQQQQQQQQSAGLLLMPPQSSSIYHASIGTNNNNSSGSSSSSRATADPLQNLQQLNGSLDERVCQPLPPPAQQYYYNYIAAAAQQYYSAAINNHLGGAAAISAAANSDPTLLSKKNGGRQTYNGEQKRTLEEEFHANRYVSKVQRTQLVEKTGLTDKQIKIWFQNRRMKKKKQEQGAMSGGDGTHDESSPSMTPITGLVIGLNGTTVKSEPENCGGGGGQQQQQEHIEPDFLKSGQMGGADLCVASSIRHQSCYQQQQQQHENPLLLPSSHYASTAAAGATIACWPSNILATAPSASSSTFNHIYFNNFSPYQEPYGYGGGAGYNTGTIAAATALQSQYQSASAQYPATNWMNCIVGRTTTTMNEQQQQQLTEVDGGSGSVGN